LRTLPVCLLGAGTFRGSPGLDRPSECVRRLPARCGTRGLPAECCPTRRCSCQARADSVLTFAEVLATMRAGTPAGAGARRLRCAVRGLAADRQVRWTDRKSARSPKPIPGLPLLVCDGQDPNLLGLFGEENHVGKSVHQGLPVRAVSAPNRVAMCAVREKLQRPMNLGDELFAEPALLLCIPLGSGPQLKPSLRRQANRFHFDRKSSRMRARTADQSSRRLGSEATLWARRSSSASHAASHSGSLSPSTLFSNSVASANRSCGGKRRASSRIGGRGCSLMASTLAPISRRHHLQEMPSN